MRRWAVWKAVWNEARQKYDKIPYSPQHYGLSTKKVPDWGDYETAAKVLALNPTRYAGLGLVMTDIQGVVGIDLDNCRADGHIAPWAREIVDTMASYTEISPSGNGLRILAHGDFSTDWNNHDVGIEVYSGHTPRFLTITGHTKLAKPMAQATPEALQALFTTHRKSGVPTANVIPLEMPELYNEMALPDVAGLELSAPVMEFLLHGPQAAEDRSGILHAAGVQLYGAGYSDAMVLSILAANDHAMDVAMAASKTPTGRWPTCGSSTARRPSPRQRPRRTCYLASTTSPQTPRCWPPMPSSRRQPPSGRTGFGSRTPPSSWSDRRRAG